jgi:hypothetical protein
MVTDSRRGWFIDFISDNEPGKSWKSGQKPAIVEVV